MEREQSRSYVTFVRSKNDPKDIYITLKTNVQSPFWHYKYNNSNQESVEI